MSGRIMAMDAKEDIRSRLNIEDVIGQYVQLKRAGRNFKGLSPFSQEKSPSFMVSPEKHIWHDFSSGKGGDVFTFIMEMEGLDFKGAFELLARKAGVDISHYGSGDSGFGKKKERLYQACELAMRFYKQVYTRVDTAQDYAKKRGFTAATLQNFGIGYAPQKNELYTALTKRGFTEQELRAAGLVVTRRGQPADMFKDRLMIPLMDAQGRVVGFTARILQPDEHAPKYINTPQTLLYDKSRHVFGLHLAKDAIRKAGYAVIVEGNADVISSHQVGMAQVVATAGTAITEHHLRMLSRFAPDVRLAFDADKAGISAAERAISIASNLGITLSIVTLSNNAKDPDELIQQDAALWQQAMQTPKDAVEWLLDVYAMRYDFSTASGKRAATDAALGVIQHISDPVLSEHYVGVIAKRSNVSPVALTEKLQNLAKPSTTTNHTTSAKPVAATVADAAQYQDHLLAMAWRHSQLRDSLRRIEVPEFAGDIRQAIAAHLKDNAPLLQSDAISVKMGELELIADTKYAALSDELFFVAADIAKRIKKEHKQAKLQRLTRQFANTPDDIAARQQLNTQIKQLIKEIEDLKR